MPIPRIELRSAGYESAILTIEIYRLYLSNWNRTSTKGTTILCATFTPWRVLRFHGDKHHGEYYDSNEIILT